MYHLGEGSRPCHGHGVVTEPVNCHLICINLETILDGDPLAWCGSTMWYFNYSQKHTGYCCIRCFIFSLLLLALQQPSIYNDLWNVFCYQRPSLVSECIVVLHLCVYDYQNVFVFVFVRVECIWSFGGFSLKPIEKECNSRGFEHQRSALQTHFTLALHAPASFAINSAPRSEHV